MKGGFIEITDQHIEIAKQIIKQGGCSCIECRQCPLSYINDKEDKFCDYKIGYDHMGEVAEYRVKACKKLLKLTEEEKMFKKEDFL